MHKPTKVEALPNFHLRLFYPDGVEGILDLSKNVGRGVFAALADVPFFETVHIGQFGQIAWSEDLEICPDSAYEDIVSQATTGAVHA